MSGFWSGLAGKLAERWLTLLVLPGAFYLATAATAHALGWAHALDLPQLIDSITTLSKNPIATNVGGQIVLLAAILTAAAAVGMAAQALASVVERVTLAADWRTWPRPLRRVAEQQTNRRRKAWTAAHATYHQLLAAAEAARAADGTQLPDNHDELTVATDKRHAADRQRTHIGLEEPDRPTWSGDRLHAVAVRVHRDLHLNLPIVWPYLWTVLPENARTDLTTARTALTKATTLTAWALLYLPLTLVWWPALPLSAGIALTGWRKTRTSTDTYAQLLEATIQLHLTTLATQLGIPHTAGPNPALGDTLTYHLRTQPPAPSPC
ncbi:hypothetical protein OG982_26935 [Streptomyces sp. NBC_01551]|uniref:hypothetical protein n=1 Tax=Streptomyces sp. NBC_01551 TaxID=2975876 RepID=UPI002252B796|nr:hypothetical protein [Streptomyces sp. NBC_01551]MCX4529287.1 hypothetical protein [Streptomyces sp. NBC_01551]